MFYRSGPPVYADADFYGRRTLIERIFGHGWIWLIGTRRIGKTSLLYRLRRLANLGDQFIAVHLSFASASDVNGWTKILHHGACESTHDDVVDAFQRAGIDVSGCATLDFFALQRELVKRCTQRNRQLWLLCDEPEAWLDAGKNALPFIKGLHDEWSSLGHGNRLLIIIASTRKLSQLRELELGNSHTSTLLELFSREYIAGLTEEEANDLIRLTQSFPGKISVDPQVLKKIKSCTGRHPFLIQHLCKKLFQPDLKGLRAFSIAEIMLDEGEEWAISQDFESLPELDQKILLEIASHGKVVTISNIERLIGVAGITPNVRDMINLGLLAEYQQGLALGNYYIYKWLTDHRREFSEVGNSGQQPFRPKHADLSLVLYQECYSLLSRCSQFDRRETLMTLFVVQELSPFKVGLPDASNSQELVLRTVAYLLGKRTPTNKPVLPIFVRVLQGLVPEEELLHEQLRRLGDNLQTELIDE